MSGVNELSGSWQIICPVCAEAPQSLRVNNFGIRAEIASITVTAMTMTILAGYESRHLRSIGRFAT